MAKETMIDVNGNPVPVLQFDHPAQEIDNAVEMVKKHANRHAANGPDPITPADIGAANALQGDTIIYVEVTGSDTTGNGSESNPYATIDRAVSGLPKNLNGYTLTIQLGNGTFPYSTSINHFYGGTLNVQGTGTETTIIDQYFWIKHCICVLSVSYLSIVGRSQATYALWFENCPNVSLNFVNINGSGKNIYGITADRSIVGGNMCNISNINGSAILSMNAIFFGNLITGSESLVGVTLGSSGSGRTGLAILGNYSLTAVAQYQRVNGGMLAINGEWK